MMRAMPSGRSFQIVICRTTKVIALIVKTRHSRIMKTSAIPTIA